ncbi:gluconokinase [Corynebacterium glucuronolyticum]|uniref:gluconokinase n=1 Tax=Corynebacterium glucuronolyticum TaxID=39791 RepID=UPI00191E94BF|nr:gluconokinase [Corynebacterium glucuronolyticum]QQU89017.1 gluconokinase [Corynebacterium glucuronolyticum]
MHIVVMGVSGCGKSTIGHDLAARLGIEYKDGDELHPKENIDKMSSGIPLTDEDRAPWLTLVGEWLHERADGVIACSALKRSYRDIIRAAAPDTSFVHLHGSYTVHLSRVTCREGHFMPSSLLDSQMATLEMLGDDEPGVLIDIDQPVDDIVEAAYQAVQ